MYQFPNLSDEEVKRRIEEHWDFTHGIPIPKFQPTCPVCSYDEVLLKHIRFHQVPRKDTKNPYRCDVFFKCTGCSYVWVHGVKIEKSMYRKHKIMYWREIKTIIERGNENV